MPEVVQIPELGNPVLEVRVIRLSFGHRLAQVLQHCWQADLEPLAGLPYERPRPVSFSSRPITRTAPNRTS